MTGTWRQKPSSSKTSPTWFKEHWLPTFENKGFFGIASQSQAKIDIQAQGSADVMEKEAAAASSHKNGNGSSNGKKAD